MSKRQSVKENPVDLLSTRPTVSVTEAEACSILAVLGLSRRSTTNAW